MTSAASISLSMRGRPLVGPPSLQVKLSCERPRTSSSVFQLMPLPPLPSLSARSKRREATVGVGVIAFDNRDLRRVNTRKQIALALLPVPYVGLRKFARRVVLDRREHHIALDAEVADRELGKTTRDGLVNLPVAARFPDRVDGGGQRMNEGMHIRRVEIVLLVPGRRRQHDVGVKTAGGHAEIEGDNQIKLALRNRIAPHHLLGLLAADLAQIPALQAVPRAEEMAQEILVPLARRSEQVRAPDEEIAREVPGMVGILAGHADAALFQAQGDVLLERNPGPIRIAR